MGRTFQKKTALLKVYEAIFEEDNVKAIRACEKASRASPEYSAMALRIKGELLIRTKQYEKAHMMYEAILSTRELPWAVLGNAIARIKLGDWQDAERTLKQLAELDETKVEALDWLGRLYISREQNKDAQTKLAEAAKISPRNIHRQRALANLAIINGEVDEAVRAFSKIITASRYSVFDTPENYLNFARCSGGLVPGVQQTGCRQADRQGAGCTQQCIQALLLRSLQTSGVGDPGAGSMPIQRQYGRGT